VGRIGTGDTTHGPLMKEGVVEPVTIRKYFLLGWKPMGIQGRKQRKWGKHLQTIKLEPPSWQLIGDLAIDQLKQGHTDYALGVIPIMIEKLVTLEKYANEDGKLSVVYKKGNCCHYLPHTKQELSINPPQKDLTD